MKKRSAYFVYIVFGFLLAFLTYSYVMGELRNGYSDYGGHAYIYLPQFFSAETFMSGLKAVPYCMWHLMALFLYKVAMVPLDPACAYTSCVFALFSYFVVIFILDKVSERAGRKLSEFENAFLSVSFCIIQPMYFYWIGRGERYLGVYSPNPLHNPTLMCARGFSLLAFCLVYDIWGAQENPDYKGLFFKTENGLKKYYISLAVVLFFSTMAKPTFSECFIPAVGIIMLVRLIRKLAGKGAEGKLYLKHFLFTFLCAVPSLLYIAIQFSMYFIFGGSYGADESNLIVTKFGEVWAMYSDNIGLSVLIGMAFAFCMVLVDTRFFIMNDFGKLALVVYAIGFFEAMLLGESGGKLPHADFLWPMMSGMLLMYIASLSRLVYLGIHNKENRKLKAALFIAWFIFAAQVLSGIVFIFQEAL